MYVRNFRKGGSTYCEDQMGHLVEHYRIVGGDEDVIEAAEVIQLEIHVPVEAIRKLLTAYPHGEISMYFVRHVRV